MSNIDLGPSSANPATATEQKNIRKGLNLAPILCPAEAWPYAYVNDIIISGTLTPSGVTGTFPYSGSSGGKTQWQEDGVAHNLGTKIFFEGGAWFITRTNSFGVVYSASKSSIASSPAGLTGWSVTVGSGQPTLTEGDMYAFPSQDFIGQQLRVGDAEPYHWYYYDGSGIWNMASPMMVTQLTPTSGNTITANYYSRDEMLYLTPAAGLGSLTLAFPHAFPSGVSYPKARNGQAVSFFSTYAVTAITMSVGGGMTLGGPSLTTLAANTLYCFVYISSLSKWVRVA